MTRWPFLTRGAHDVIVASLHRELSTRAEELSTLRRQLADVQDRLLDRVLPKPLAVAVGTVTPRRDVEKSDTAKLIEELASGDAALARELVAFADRERADDETEETIRARLSHYQPGDPDEDGDWQTMLATTMATSGED